MTKWRIGLKLYSTNTESRLPAALELARRKAFDYLELYVVPGSRATAAAWKKIPLPVVIHAPHLHHGMNFADAARRESNRQNFEEVRYFADLLGADCIICHGGTGGTPEEVIRQIGALHDGRIALENKPVLQHPQLIADHSDWRCRGADFAEFKRMVEALRVNVCHDLVHTICAAATLRRDWHEEIRRFEALNPTIHHLADMVSERDELDTHEGLGRGVLDFREVLAVVPEGARITLETPKSQPDRLDDFVAEVRLLSEL